ncbi:MAG: hypothetical protein MJA29_11990 [Candidatus Omnitrophica bacterium]|nr:hypothetical protein [Candidatus Omnitrophota bacterium]
MKNFCCEALKNAFGYTDSHFSTTESEQTYLLHSGYNDVPFEKIKRLAEATFVENPEMLRKMPEYPLDKIIRSPMIVQIKYCPFCGKKLNQQ